MSNLGGLLNLNALEFGKERSDLESHLQVHTNNASALGASSSQQLRASSSPSCYSYFSFRCSSEGPASKGIEVIQLPSAPLYSKMSSSSGSGRQQRGWAYSFWFRIPAVSEQQRNGRDVGRGEAILARFTSAAGHGGNNVTSNGNVETELVLVWDDLRHADPYSLIVRTNIGGVISGPSATTSSSSSNSTSISLGGFLAGASSSSNRRPQFVECLNIQRDALPGRWSHLTISQTNPKSSFGKMSKLTLVLNGRIRLDTQYACQPLPFSRISIGGPGFIGHIAQPQLYGVCLSSVHISSLFSRGPNSATLAHALGVPVPANLAPEIIRAGLSTSQQSLEFYSGESAAAVSEVYLSHHAAGGTGNSTSKGSDFNAGRSGVGNAGHGSEFCVPPVLFYLSASMTLTSVSNAVDGRFYQVGGGGGGGIRSSSEGLSPCVAWYSKGASYGDVLLEDSKSALSEQLPAVVGYETHLTAVSPLLRTTSLADDNEGNFLSTSLFDAPIASFGLSVRAVYHEGKGSSESSQSYDISTETMHSAGGSMRLLELLRILPMPFSSLSSISFSSALSKGILSLAALIRDDQSHREEFFQMLGFVSLAQILREHVQRARAQLTLSAASLERKHRRLRSDSNHSSESLSSSASSIKPELFSSGEPLGENNSDEVDHPITENVWDSVRSLLFCSRRAEAVPSDNLGGGSPWNHLFCQSGRYLLCDWTLWTEPIVGDVPSPSGPSPLHALLDRMTSTIVISPDVVSGFSSVLSDLACASPIDFSTFCGVDFQRACDGYLSCLKSLSLALIQVQLKEQSIAHPWLIDETIFATTNVDASESTSLRLDAIAGASKRADTMSSSCNTVKGVSSRVTKVVDAWSSALSCLSLAPLGATFVSGKSGNAPIKTQVDVNKVQQCVEALLRFCAHTCQLHSEFQEQQEGLLKIQNDLYMKRFSRLRQQQQLQHQHQQPALPPFNFIESGRDALDPFSEGCRTGIELLTRLLKSFPHIVHPIVESVGGLMTITACAEAPCEKVTLAVMRALPVIVALRRQVDPRKYGEVPAPGTKAATEQLTPEQEAAAKAAAKRAAILSERAKRERLCRVLWNTLETKAVNASSALAAAALDLVLSPDIPYYVTDPSAMTVSGSGTQGGIGRGGGSGGGGGGGGGGRTDRANSTSISAVPAAGDFLHSSESGGGKIMCPEAIPVVFLLLSMSNARMIRRRKAAALLRANPWLPPSDLCARVGCLALEAGSAHLAASSIQQDADRETSGRMQCVHDLSLLIKGARSSNAHAWLEERGWQLSILGLVLMPHTSKATKWIVGNCNNKLTSVCVTDDHNLNSNYSSDGSSSMLSSTFADQRSFGKGSHGSHGSHGARGAEKQVTSTISAIAFDMLVCLHCIAFEYEEGSNVFISTLSSLSERYKSDSKTSTLLAECSNTLSTSGSHSEFLQGEIALGISFVLSGVFDRISRERPRLSRFMRSNILRMLLFALVRLQGKPLASVSASALPVILWMREQKEKFEGTDLWIVLRVIVNGILVPSAGVLRAWTPSSLMTSQNASDNLAGTITSPNSDLFHESATLLQSLVSNEIQSLHDPEIAAKEAAQASSSRLSIRRVPSFFSETNIPRSSASAGGIAQSAKKEGNSTTSSANADFYSSMISSPGGQTPSSVSSTDHFSLSSSEASKQKSDGGSRVDAVLFVLSGLRKVIDSTEVCFAAAERCTVDEPPFRLPISASSLQSIASDIQGFAVVHVLSMLNNSNFGPWRRCIEHYTDQAFMMGRGKRVPVGGFKNSAAAAVKPITSSSSSSSSSTLPLSEPPTAALFRPAESNVPSISLAGADTEIDLLDVALTSPFDANVAPSAKQTLVFDDPFASILPSANNEQALVTNQIPFPVSSSNDYDPFGLSLVDDGARSSLISSVNLNDEGSSLATNQPPSPIDRAKAVFAALEPALIDVEKRYDVLQSYKDFILSETSARAKQEVTSTGTNAPLDKPLFSSEVLDSREAVAADALVDGADDAKDDIGKLNFAGEDDTTEDKDKTNTVVDQNFSEVSLQTNDPSTKIITPEDSLVNHIQTLHQNASLPVHPKWLRKLLLSETLPVQLSIVTTRLDNSALGDHRQMLYSEEQTRQAIRTGKEAKLSSRVRVHWRAIRLMLSRHHRIALMRAKQRNAQNKQNQRNLPSSSSSTVVVGSSLSSFSEEVPTIKIDSHETRRSRIRMRILSVRGERLKAMTYTEYGRQGVPAAAIASTSGSATLSKVSTGGEDVARALALAGALKKTELIRTNSRGDDDEPEDARAEASADQDGDDAIDDVEGQSNDESCDQTSDARSVAASSVGGSTSIQTVAVVEDDVTFVPDVTEDISQRVSSSMSNLTKMPSAPCLLVKPAGSGPGTFYLHTSRRTVVWEPRDPQESAANKDLPFSSPDRDSVFPPTREVRFKCSDITAIFLRCYRLNDIACEFFAAAYGGPRLRRYFFVFPCTAERDAMVNRVIESMPRSVLTRLLANAGKSRSEHGEILGSIYGEHSGHAVAYSYIQRPFQRDSLSASLSSMRGGAGGGDVAFTHSFESNFRKAYPGLLRSWRNRELSTFDYLMAVNTLAGRSFNDITQYPVFPWVLADYLSQEVDLTSPSTFRDLSRPLGALTSERLKEFRMRYETFDDDVIPKFMYGSHYSTAVGTVVHYLLRLYPFTNLHVAYQSGHFDVADRLFASIADAWAMNTTSLSEVKELTPEFYSSQAFLVNSSRHRFGNAHNGQEIDHVQLPPWARGSPALFQRTMRASLESDIVSSSIHSWVDLIFGKKQRGDDAALADNVFYYMTYAGKVDWDSITDASLRRATQSQITHYGQTPLQILLRSHEERGPFPTVVPPPFVPHSTASLLANEREKMLARVSSAAARCEDLSACGIQLLSTQESGGIASRSRSSSSTLGPADVQLNSRLAPLHRSSSTASGSGGGSAGGGRGFGGLGRMVMTVAAGLAEATGATTSTSSRGGNRGGGGGAGGLAGGRSSGVLSNSQRSSVSFAPVPGLARPLSAEMRLYLSIKQPISSRSALESTILSSSPFVSCLKGASLELNRSFSHVCTVPQLGSSIWRPDAPSALPLRVSECCSSSARPEAVALVGVAEEIGYMRASTSSTTTSSSSTKTHRSNSIDFQHRSFSPSFSSQSNIPPASVIFSLGDILMQGSAPPPATLSVRIDIKDIHSLIAFDSRSEWSRSSSDPYITPVDTNIDSPSSCSSDVLTMKKHPFAFPLRYQRVLQLNGAAALSQTNDSVYSLGIAAAKAARDSSVADIERMLGPGVTPEHLSMAVAAMEKQQEHSSAVFHVWWPIAPEGYVALGCVVTAATIAPYVEVVPETPISSAEEMMVGGTNATSFDFNSNEVFPVGIRPPSPRPTNSHNETSGANESGASSSNSSDRVRAGVSFETRPVPPNLEAILCVHVGLVNSSPLRSVVPVPGVDLDLPPRPKRSASRSASGSSSATASSSDEESWFVLSEDSLKSSSQLSQSQREDPLPDQEELPLESPASVAGSNSRTAADMLASTDLTKEKIALLRASRSRGCALYTVQNSVSTFVLPVPVSVQKSSSDNTDDNPLLILSPTAIPPAPEHIDATLHKAHVLSKAVAYDFSPRALSVLLQQSTSLELELENMRRGRNYEEKESDEEQNSADVSVASTVVGANKPRLFLHSPSYVNTRFPDQNWSCDATSTSSEPTTVILRHGPFGSIIRQTNLVTNATDEPAGFSHGWDFSSLHMLTGPPKEVHLAEELSYSFSDIPDVEAHIRAPIVCIRVRSSAQIAALLSALGLPPSQQLSQAQLALQAVQPNSVLAIDANGCVDFFNVFSQPLEKIEVLQAKLESAVVAGARVLGYFDSIDKIPEAAKQPFVPTRLRDSMLPHSRVRIARIATQSANMQARLQLTNIRHVIGLANANSNIESKVEASDGSKSSSLLSLSQHGSIVFPCVSSFPVALGDLVSGGIAVTSAGRYSGVLVSALDTRDRSSSIFGSSASAITSSGLPNAPFAQKRSAAATAAANAADIGRSVLSSIDRTLAASIPQDLSAKEKALSSSSSGYVETMPSWTGNSPSSSASSSSGSGGVVISGEFSLPINRPVAACALALDEDALVSAYEDGTIMFWKLSGTHPVNAYVSGVSARTRPDAVIRSPSTGAVAATCIAVWRDGDAAIIGYPGEAWLIELSRGRTLQQFLLSTPSCATEFSSSLSNGALLSQPVCTGACFNSDGSVVLASTVFAMVRADNISASARNKSSISHAGPAFSELVLYSTESSSSSDSEPVAIASIQIRAKVTCLSRVRNGGTGDYEGAGALLALGLSDGSLSLLDGATLNTLETWMMPQRTPCFSVDVSPCTGYLVAGCANGIVAAIALPAFLVTVPCEVPEEILGAFETEAETPSQPSALVEPSALSPISEELSETNQAASLSISNSERALNAVNAAKDVGKALFNSFWKK